MAGRKHPTHSQMGTNKSPYEKKSSDPEKEKRDTKIAKIQESNRKVARKRNSAIGRMQDNKF